MGFNFFVEEIDQRITATQEGLRGVRKFKIPWAQSQAFVTAMKGEIQAIGVLPAGSQPSAWPNLPNLQVSDVEVQPWPEDVPGGTAIVDPTRDSIDYNYALATVYYAGAQQNAVPVPFGRIAESYRLSGEFLTMSGRAWRWGTSDDDLPPDTNPGILIPTIELVLTWTKMPLVPWQTLALQIGTINSDPFLPQTRNYPAGTVLLIGAEVNQHQQDDAQNPYWSCVLHYKVRLLKVSNGMGTTDLTWNMFFRADAAPNWQEITTQADGSSPYDANDLTSLFDQGAT